MKLYVLPVERACDARCHFCITNFREPVSASSSLDPQKLEHLLATIDIKKIEITGGGEPTLHPAIDEIITLCGEKAPTQLYTHGARLQESNVVAKALAKLSYLCISRAHYLEAENERIMGISYDFQKIRDLNVPLKLSLLLHRSGINTAKEVQQYLQWAQGKAQKVVIRQLFEHDYRGKLPDEFISSEQIFRELDVSSTQQTEQGNPLFNVGDLECEFELRSCACEMDNPVLHANGKLYRGWSGELL